MILHIQQRQDWIRGRRERRKLAKQARLRRQILRYFFLCFLLTAGAAGFRYLPWSISDVNRDIKVAGNKVVSVEQVRNALSGAVGKPLYRLNPSNLEARLKDLEAVRYAFVRRYVLPRPRLCVEVMEEFPWATFSTSEELPAQSVISETGRMIPIQTFPSILQPDFKIYGPANLHLTAADVSQWAGWTNYVAAQTGQKVDFVDLRLPHDIRIQDGEFYLKAGAADSSLTRRLGRLASVIPSLGDLRDHLQYIDLGLDNNVPLKLAEKPRARSAEFQAGAQQSMQSPLPGQEPESPRL